MPLGIVETMCIKTSKNMQHYIFFVSLSLNKKNEGMKIDCYFPHDVNTLNYQGVTTLIDEESASGYGVYWTNTIRKVMTNGYLSQRGGHFLCDLRKI